MSAREMFEKLGYEIEQDNEVRLVYIKVTQDNGIDDGLIEKVIFEKIHRWISATSDGYFIPISFEELQAINKQVEELGWNER